jgi:hypothetical protein
VPDFTIYFKKGEIAKKRRYNTTFVEAPDGLLDKNKGDTQT